MKLITKVKLPKTSAHFISESALFSWIDSDFENYGLSKVTSAAKEVDCSVYELDKDGTFKDIYARFDYSLDDMVMTQGQVLEFVKNNRDLLSDWSTFFLLKRDNKFFVAGVYRFGGELRAYVHLFEREFVWDAKDRRRFVLPQLDSSKLKSFDPDTTEERLIKIENWIKKEANFINPFD